MKTFKKVISGALAVLTLFSCSACFGEKTGHGDTDKPNEIVTDIATAPDYSTSTKKLNMFAYVGPTNGRYTLINGTSMEVDL